MGYFVPGFYIEDKAIDVPLCWSDPGETIEVFWREVCLPQKRGEELPLLVFLQGGPGGEGPRPMPGSGWLPEAVQHYRVLLPDQRGTGRSTRVEGEGISADTLACYLADSVIRDFEHIRQTVYGGQAWTTFGQSYGGFLTLAYLSLFPQGVNAALVAGGIPGLPPDPKQVYSRTFPRAKRKSELFYERYPQDVELVGAVADRIAQGDVRLPNRDLLSVPRLQSLGLDLGMKPGAERMHWLFDRAFARPGQLSEVFLQQVYERTASVFDPLFWTLQEFIYGSESNGPMAWAAATEYLNHPEFSPDRRPLLFTSEMTFPWMFDEVAALRPFKQAVCELMQRVDWPRLYDLDRLAANEAPLQSIAYFDDLYVDQELQVKTLSLVGNSQYWMTNEYEHDGIQTPGVFTRLNQLLVERGGPIKR
jgi:pimeloyl-ACP methyl ester carboxylesterase